jgi:Domain of Unknown Function (DUF1521)
MINNATSPAATTTTITISAGEASAGDAPPPTTTRSADGSVNFENQNYYINVHDTGEINVTNKLTSEMYRIQNDLRVDVDGVQAFRFEGTTTFELDDGTKITIDTKPDKEVIYEPMITSVLTIIDGLADYGVQISGLNSHKTGELAFTEAHQKELDEWVVGGGNVLDENLAGSGFVSIDENGNIDTVDQKWINNTDIVKLYWGSLFRQYSNMTNFLSGISRINFCSLSSTYTLNNFNQQEHKPKLIKRQLQTLVKTEQKESVTTFAKRKSDDALDPSGKEIRYKFQLTFARCVRTD